MEQSSYRRTYQEEAKMLEKKRKLSDQDIKTKNMASQAEKGLLTNFIKDSKTIDILNKKGIKALFPIQYQTFKIIYQKNDLIARDRTGSGKTLAFALPILERFRDRKAFSTSSTKFLIVLPTRQLAFQVKNEIQSIRHHSNEFSVIPVYGGTDIREQISSIRRGADIIVSTPGRLLDLLQKGVIRLDDLQVVCLDEADEMLRQGFQEDIEKIFEYIRKHAKRSTQNLLFSATMPGWVIELSRKYLSDDKKFVDLIKNSQIKTSKTIEHLAIQCSYRPTASEISDVVNHYCGRSGRAIIFTETKKDANDIGSRGNLRQQAHILHGDIPQKQRQYTFKAFKQGRIQCLVATNVAARGLDIPQVDIIVQVQPPKDVETYIHRSGRTGRAGRSGVCVTFYNYQQRHLVDKIQRTAQVKLRNIPVPKGERGERERQINVSKEQPSVSRYPQQSYEVPSSGQSRFSSQPPPRQDYRSSYTSQPPSFRPSNIPPPPPTVSQVKSSYSQAQQQPYSKPVVVGEFTGQLQIFNSQLAKQLPKTNQKNILIEMQYVSNQVIPYFSQVAENLIKSEKDPVTALAKTLAYITGVRETSKKSLLTGRSGYTTYSLRTPLEFNTLSYVYNFLSNILPQPLLNQVKSLTRSGPQQVCFDLQQRLCGEMDKVCDFLGHNRQQFAGFIMQEAEVVEIYNPKPTENEQRLPHENTGDTISESLLRQAIRRKRELQVFISGLPLEIGQSELAQFLKSKGVIVAGIKLQKVDEPEPRANAFVLCLDERSLKCALKASGQRCGARFIKVVLAAK